MVNKKTGIDYVYDIPFIKDYNFSTDGLAFYDEDGNTPVLSSFINRQQTIQIKNLANFTGQVYGFFYATPFEEAVPPMIIENKPVAKNLSIDSVFVLNTNEPFSLINEGLYCYW